MSQDEVELIKLQNKYLAETVLLLAQDLTRAGMSEYQPDYSEMLALGNWAYGLLENCGIDLSTLEIYTEEV